MKSKTLLPQFRIFATATFFAMSAGAHADNGTWNVDADGTWATPGNWLGNTIADGSGFTANFTNDITADRVVTLDAPKTIGNIVFDDAGATGDSAWTLTGSTLTLAGGTPTITTNTNATISSILAGTAGLTKAGAGTLTLNGANTYTGGTTVSAGTLLVNAGNYPKNGSNRTALGAMSVASGATLNLLNNGTAGSFAAGQCLVIRDITLSGAGTVITSGTGVTDFWDGDNLANLSAFTGTFRATSGTMSFQTAKTSGVNAMILDTGAYLDLRTNPDANGGLTLSSLTGTGTVGASWQAMTLAVGALNASSQFDGVIQNTVPGFSNSPTIALKKIGSGTLTLTGANTYTGATTINGGTLELNGGTLASTSALTLGGGTLSLTGSGTTQTLNGLTTTANTGSGILLSANKTLTLGALTSAGTNSALNFNTAAGGADASTGALGNSTVVLTGQTAGNVINKGFTVTDATGFGLATVDGANNVVRRTTTTLLSASGASSPTDYQINNNADGAAADGSSSLAITASQSAGSITVDTTTAAGTLSLNSGVILSNNTWNFGGVGSNAYQITGNAGGASLKSVAAGDTITFNNYNTGVVTIASNILANGTNAVIFNGSGTTSLSGANTYTGGTFVNAGTLIQDLSARSGTINNIGAFTVNAGAVYELKSGTNTGADTTLFQNNSLSGTGTVRKTGAGYIGIAHTGSNTSTFNGTYDIQAGILGFNSGVQGSGLASINITGDTAKLDVRTGTVKIDALNGVVGSQVYISHSAGATLSLGNNNGSGTFNGTLINGSSTLALIKNGTGTQTLTGGNTYTGATTINGGTLAIQNPGNNVWGSNITVNSGATLNLLNTLAGYANRGTNNIQKTISGDGSLVVSGGGWVVMAGVNNTVTLTGGISVLSGGLGNDGGATSAFGTNTSSLSVSSGAAFDLRGGASQFDALNGGGVIGNSWNGTTLTVGVANGSGTFNGVIQSGGPADSGTGGGGGALALIKNGTGTQTLGGANTFTGGLTVNGGTLNYTGGGSVTGAGGNVLIGSGATLNLSGTTTNQLEANGTWAINGTLANTSAKATSIRTTSITLNGGTMNSTQSVDTIHGAFFSYLNTTITANGTGNVISGNGDLGINTGTTLTLGTALAGDRLLVSTVLKNVSGAGGVTKTGLGTVTFSGVNTYTGATTVNGGALIINGSISNSVTTVNSGGMIGGSGITGALTVASGGTLSPGNSIDSLDITGNLTLGGGSFSIFEINATLNTADLAIASANLAFGGTLTVTNLDGTLADGDSFDLFNWATTSGSFDTVILPSLDTGLTWDTSDLYNDGTIAVTVIPEPAAALLGSLGLLALLRRRRA